MGNKGDAGGGGKGLAAWGHHRVQAFLAPVNNFVVCSPKLVSNVLIMVVEGQNDKQTWKRKDLRRDEVSDSYLHLQSFRSQVSPESS